MFTVAVTNQFVNTSLPPAQLNVSGGAPSSMAVLLDSTNFSGAIWTPYASSSITVSLGTTEGWHDVWIGLRGRMTTSQQSWQWLRFKLDTTPPQLVITNPVSTNISQPMIQLQGYCPEALTSFRYNLTNAAGLVTNELVLVTSQFYDTSTFEFTTNTFQAFDISLTNGPNTITLYATDLAGNVTTTNLTFVLDYSSDTNPPAINLFWPQEGTQISGSSFTWRGAVDDFTATVTVSTVDTNGVTNSVNALVERNGNFWIEDLPLAEGTNNFTLRATDAAGNSSSTNINVVKSTVNFTMHSMSAGDTTIRGSMDTSGYTVWVNGQQATPDGNNWTATNVPMISMGNTTIYQARAIPNTDNGGNGSGGDSSSSTNPTSQIAIDVEADPDKPEGVYISSYSLAEHWEENSDVSHSTWDHTLNWRDGKGVTDTTHEVGHNPEFDYDVVYVDSWSATSWPQPPSGIVTERVYNNIEGISDTNVYDGFWPALGSEHCDVTFQTNFGNVADTGDVLMTWTRKAQTAYALNTGRKAAPGAKNLWVISAAATEKAVHTSTSSYPPFGVDVTNIPYEQIQIDTLGHLGSDGILYAVLPDGHDPDLTPEVNGAPYYGIGMPIATKYPVTIKANGIDLSTNTPEFCVGQHVMFTLSGLPSFADAKASWVLPDKFVNQASTNSAGCVSYTDNPELLKSLTVTNCWYVNGQGGTAVILAVVHFSNGQYVPIAELGNFKVYRPTIQQWQIPIYGNGTPQIMIWSGNLGVGNAGNGLNVMTFMPYIASTNAGTAGFSQLISGYFVNDSTKSTDGYELDNVEWYRPQKTVSSTAWAQNNIPFDDGPHLSLANVFNTTGMNLAFETYLRFRPNAGNPNDNIFVTLQLVTWGVTASADDTNGILPGGWQIDPGSFITGPEHSDSDVFPKWTEIFNNQ